MAATTIITNQGLLQLLQLTSPSLPIGGFSWSQGLEYAIESGWLKTEKDTEVWLQGMLSGSLAYLDVPVLIRLHRALKQNDQGAFVGWNEFLLSSRETQELLLEDIQMGAALKRLLLDLGVASAEDFPQGDVAYPSAFALAAVTKAIDERSMALGFLWGWLENQIAASLKIFPLGQTAGQRIFQSLVEPLSQAVEHAFGVDDESLGNSLPGQVMASMLHEEQYSRLFRS